jgi:HK97 family phage major capsid protein
LKEVTKLEKVLELRQERTRLVKECEDIRQKAEAEKRYMSEDEQKAFDAKMGEVRQNRDEETRLIELHEAKGSIQPIEPNKPVPGNARKSIGQAFIESRQYQDMIKSGRFESDAFETREIISSDDASAGGLVVAQRVPGIVAEPEQQLRIRDLLAKGRTTSNSIEYVRETVYTSAAAAVAESKKEAESEKAESTIRTEKESVSVVTLAHWIPASRQIVADAPQLADYINTRLLYGLKLEEEDQLLNGEGGGDIDGLLSNAQAFSEDTEDDDTPIDIIRRAILQAELANYPVSGVVMHPRDWANIELHKDSNNRYIWVQVTSGGQLRLWRVPVVPTQSIAEDTFLIGAFSLGAQIWDRESASIRLSEHHSDYFTKNMVAILCEERLALTIYRPQAFVTGSLTIGS